MAQFIPPSPASTPQAKTSALAVTSLVLGIIGFTLCLVAILTAVPTIICGHLAISKINSSGGTLTGKGLAIAGLVLGYLSLLMIPLLIAIAVPNFVKARNAAMTNMCINNLRQIDAAKNQWALEHKKNTGAVPTTDDLKPYLKNGIFPKCLDGGTYTIGPVGSDPTCSKPGHTLNPNDVNSATAQSGSRSATVTTTVTTTITGSTAATEAAKSAPPAKGDGYFIPAMERADMVYEPKSNILYITDSDSVLRYQLNTKKFLPPMTVGGDLRGIDISPDNKYLAVADASGNNDHIGFHWVDLTTGMSKLIAFPGAMLESGTFAVAFGADSEVWVSTSLNGSGFVPLRKYNPQTRMFLKMPTVAQDSMLTASADRQSIGLAEAHMTPGSYGLILKRCHRWSMRRVWRCGASIKMAGSVTTAGLGKLAGPLWGNV